MRALTAKIRMLIASLVGLGLVGCSLYQGSDNNTAINSMTTGQRSDVATSAIKDRTSVQEKTLFDEKIAVYKAVAENRSAQNIDHPLFNTEQTRWAFRFDDPALVELIENAVEYNASLLIQASKVNDAESQVRAEGIKVYPSLMLGLNLKPSIEKPIEESVNRAGYSISSKAKLELQRWQTLSIEEQDLSLSFAKEKAAFSQQVLQLTSDIAIAWYKLNYLRQQLGLLQQRRDTLKNALRVVEQGVGSEQYSPLDLALRQKALAEEQGYIQFQQQLITEQVELLQSLTGVALDRKQLATAMLPVPADLAPFSSALLTQQPELQKHWLKLLRQYPELAIANKEGFPISIFSPEVQTIDKPDHTFDKPLPVPSASTSPALSNDVQLAVSDLDREYRRQLADTLNKVSALLSDETALTKQIATSQQQLSELRTHTKNLLSQYKVGQISLQQLLISQKAMLDHEAGVLFLRHQQLQNRIILNRLVGGLPVQTVSSNQAL